MFEYGFDEKPEFAEALGRLAAQRQREFLLRVLVWVWAGGIILWLLPFGAWSAESLKPAAAMVAGLALVIVQLAMLMRYRAVTSRETFAYVTGGATHPEVDVFNAAPRAEADTRFARPPGR